MKKLLRIFLLVFAAIFVVIQFYQPGKNQGETTADHLFEKISVHEGIQTILRSSCLDCHSNQTKYLWYHNIAPVSWVVNNHITGGKKELNLSEWGEMNALDQLMAIDKMVEEVEKDAMPLKSYQLLHPKAKLSEDQKNKLYEWAEKLSEELLIKMEEK